MTREVVAAIVAIALAGVGCSDVPPECSEDTLAKVSAVEAASEKTYAFAAVRVAVEKVAAAREAVEKEKPRFAIMRSYGDAKALCVDAAKLGAEATTAIELAKKQKADIDAMMATTTPALDEAGAALLTGRALLDAVPQPEADAQLRDVQVNHRATNTEVDAALATLKGAGYVGDLTTLSRHRAALDKSAADAKSILLGIRRGATNACKPMIDKTTHLYVGNGRARSHDGFAILEAGPSEESASGYVVVVARVDGGCRTLRVTKADAPDALSTAVAPTMTKTWRVGGDLPVKLLFAWTAPRAWFVNEGGGSWSFDVNQVNGFEGKCGSVTCAEPAITPEHIDVSCTCNDPKKPDELDLTRSVRFSWHGNAVLAER